MIGRDEMITNNEEDKRIEFNSNAKWSVDTSANLLIIDNNGEINDVGAINHVSANHDIIIFHLETGDEIELQTFNFCNVEQSLQLNSNDLESLFIYDCCLTINRSNS